MSPTTTTSSHLTVPWSGCDHPRHSQTSHTQIYRVLGRSPNSWCPVLSHSPWGVQNLPRDSHMSKPQVDSPVPGILSRPTVPWSGQDHLRDHMSHPQVDFGILSCPTVPWSGWECPRDFHIFSSHSPVRWMNTQ